MEGKLLNLLNHFVSMYLYLLFRFDFMKYSRKLGILMNSLALVFPKDEF